MEFDFKLSGPTLLHKSTSVCKMRSFFQAGVGRDWERVLENLQRLPPPPRPARVLHRKLHKLRMAVEKRSSPTWDGQTAVRALSPPSQPRLEAWLIVPAQGQQGEDKGPFLVQGTFPHYSWMVSVLPTLRKTAWPK